MALIQINDDSSSDQSSNNGEKWLESRYMVNMMEQAKFVWGLDVRCKRKKSRVLTQKFRAQGKDVLISWDGGRCSSIRFVGEDWKYICWTYWVWHVFLTQNNNIEWALGCSNLYYSRDYINLLIITYSYLKSWSRTRSLRTWVWREKRT